MFKQRVGELAARPHIVAADATVTQAAVMMAREGISCLAAVRGARVVGFLTESALVRHLGVDLDPDTGIQDLLVRPSGGVSRDMTVQEAVRIMLDRRERHLPVMDHGGSMLGLVTEKELVDALAVDFMVESAMCSDIMRAAPLTLAPERPVRDALDLMRSKGGSCVLAVAEGRPVGIFSERDATSKIMGRPERLDEPLSAHMNAPVISVPKEGMVYKVILFMRQKGVRRVAVVARDGSLAGLLSQHDILTYARRMG
ncbi:CBS domain-containing protein [Solidesulfovibrio sp.]|uniref:CBS domain-containing protein n=1 Tax=Solidesulfovibrio sp. TaxID=2910990 RepID=UPI002619F644|nr:CBS domain-containing protein [Solidesulfovibrio sp.]